MQNETFIEFVVDLICNEHFLKMDKATKAKFYANIQKRYEIDLEDSFNQGYYKGKIEGIESMSKALNQR